MFKLLGLNAKFNASRASYPLSFHRNVHKHLWNFQKTYTKNANQYAVPLTTLIVINSQTSNTGKQSKKHGGNIVLCII